MPSFADAIDYWQKLRNADFLSPDAFWLLVPLAFLILLGLIARKRSALVLLIRAAAAGALIVALADPVDVHTSSSKELAAVFDLSSSVSERGSAALAASLRRFLEQVEDDTTMQIVPFAAKPAADPVTISDDGDLDDLSAVLASRGKALDTGDTDIAAALRNAVARSPSAAILLLSDGFETIGEADVAARQAAEKGVKIYPLIPDERAFRRENLSISALHLPLTANAGERVEVRASIKNSFEVDSEAGLEIWLDKEKLFSQRLIVKAGQERMITIPTPALDGGLKRARAVLFPLSGGGGKSELHRWISIKEKSKVLLISGSEADARVLRELVRGKGFGVEDVIADGRSEVPVTFEKYSSVILNNTAKRQLPAKFLPALKEFVQRGGGLLMVGGERSYGLGDYIDTPLEEIAPVKFKPPQTKKRRLTKAVALVIDKSGSMVYQNKILGAKEAALLSIQSLNDDDSIAVIGFDHAPFVIIDLEKVGEVKDRAEYRLRNLTAAGQTNLLPALSAARQKLKNSDASRKHIIVLSDGKIPLSDNAYIEEINQLREAGITVSGVALGIDADVPFMKLLSKYGRGAFYHTNDPTRLAQIFVQDIKVSTGEKTLAEDQDFYVGQGPSGVRSTTVAEYPPLRGFVETLPKKRTNIELVTKRGNRLFPILSSWNYGKGKVLAFTSDANGRWSSPWLRWRNLPKFWGDLTTSVRDNSGTKTGEIDFDLRYSVNRKTITLDLAIFDSKLKSEASPRLSARIIEPGGEVNQTLFRPVRKGRFEADIANGRPGDYRLDIEYGDVKLPPLAITLPGEAFGEIPGQGINVQSLAEIAYLTGGAINPDPTQVLGRTRISDKSEQLYPPLLLLAFLLVLFEAFLRETGLSFLGRFGRRRPEVLTGPRRPAGNYQPRHSPRPTDRQAAA